jgi:hypothetical protein
MRNLSSRDVAWNRLKRRLPGPTVLDVALRRLVSVFVGSPFGDCPPITAHDCGGTPHAALGRGCVRRFSRTVAPDGPALDLESVRAPARARSAMVSRSSFRQGTLESSPLTSWR